MEDNRTLVYNTEKDRLVKPEYGRAILDMVNSLKKIESREKRSEQPQGRILMTFHNFPFAGISPASPFPYLYYPWALGAMIILSIIFLFPRRLNH